MRMAMLRGWPCGGSGGEALRAEVEVGVVDFDDGAGEFAGG